MAGYFARSTPAARCTPAGQAELASAARRQRRIATAQLMVVLDSTVVNVALPHIQRSLGFSGAGLEWVVNAYALASGGLLLLGGRAGDLLGRRRMLVTGLLLFSAASLAGGSPPPRHGCWRPGPCRAPAGRSSRRPRWRSS
jgi:Major Facilitator Superfamily